MKTSTQKLLGWGSALVLASSVIAGPGPQFWQQQDKIRAENAAKAQAAKSSDAPGMACASCKTTDIRDSKYVGPGSKGHYEWTTVGTKHACPACGGAVTTVRGNTTSDMTANCPLCTKAKAANAACCNATS